MPLALRPEPAFRSKRIQLFFGGPSNYDQALRLLVQQTMTKSTPTVRNQNMQAMSDVRSRLLALVRSILEQNSITAELGLESRLVDVGLTSMDMVKLMLIVEAEFDFTIPQAEITPENFQSVKTLQRLVVAQLNPGTAV